MVRLFAALFALGLLAQGCDNSGCGDHIAPVADLCVPPALASGQQTAIEVRELCGVGCSHMPSCSAYLRNGALVLDVHQEICSDATFGNCLNQPCIQRVVRCALPELAPGDYTVTAPGAADQLLRVRTGGVASCRFAGDGGV